MGEIGVPRGNPPGNGKHMQTPGQPTQESDRGPSCCEARVLPTQPPWFTSKIRIITLQRIQHSDSKGSVATIWPKCSDPLDDRSECMMGLVWSTCLSDSEPQQEQDSTRSKAHISWFTMSVPHLAQQFFLQPKEIIPPLSRSDRPYVVSVWQNTAKCPCYQDNRYDS